MAKYLCTAVMLNGDPHARELNAENEIDAELKMVALLQSEGLGKAVGVTVESALLKAPGERAEPIAAAVTAADAKGGVVIPKGVFLFLYRTHATNSDDDPLSWGAVWARSLDQAKLLIRKEISGHVDSDHLEDAVDSDGELYVEIARIIPDATDLENGLAGWDEADSYYIKMLGGDDDD